MRRDESLLALHLVLALVGCVRAASASTDTWAVLISSSRYWLNYRHSSNALGVYQAIRRQGIPDSHIILMLAEQPACSPRNIYPGRMHLDPVGGGGGGAGDLLGGDAEVDYRGRDVSVDSVLRVLTGHHLPGTPASKRLLSGPASRVLLFLSGHGGDEFLKFHDEEELLAADIADAVHQMAAAGRYGELLLVADTCQASTLFAQLEAGAAPSVLAVASSKLGQSSYAHHVDRGVGQHVVDQMSYHLQAFLRSLPPHPAAPDWARAAGGPGGPGAAAAAEGPSLQQLVDHVAAQRLSSEVQVRRDLSPRSPARVPVADFFAAPLGGCPHAAGQWLATPASRRVAEALLGPGAAGQLPSSTAQAWPPAALPGAAQQRSEPWAHALHAAGRPLPSTAPAASVAWSAVVWAVLIGLALRLSKA